MKIEPPVDHVYSSPYYRCLQTIAPFVAARCASSNSNNTPTVHAAPDDDDDDGDAPATRIRVEPGLSEWFGLAPWEHPSPAPLARLRELFPRIDAAYAPDVPIAPPRHGESLAGLHDRVAAAMDVLVQR
jgi:transcription factor C subunit 7